MNIKVLTYRLDSAISRALYLQLYDGIRADILSGKLASGEKLPSKRALASHLNVSVVTVENTYSQLAAEGFIHSVQRSGWYVRADARFCTTKSSEATVSTPQIQPHITKQAETSLDLSAGGIRANAFPYALWVKTLRRTVSYCDPQALMTTPPAQGILQLREAIAQHTEQFHGVRIHPERIVVGAGAQNLYGLLVQLLGTDRIWAVENPGYPQLQAIYTANGVLLRHIPTDDSGLIVEFLSRSGAHIAHVSPTHQFPTGAVMPASRRFELLNWAHSAPSRWIIEDDYDCEFRLSGQPVPPLLSLEDNDRVIYVNTFSRTLSPAFRIGYMVLPTVLVERFREKLGFYASTVSAIEQYTLAHFIREGHFARHILRMRNQYREARKSILAILTQSKAREKMTILGVYDGLHFLIRVHTALSDKALLSALQQKGLSVRFLSDYWQGSSIEDSHTFIIDIPNLETETAKKAILRLCDTVAALPQ